MVPLCGQVPGDSITSRVMGFESCHRQDLAVLLRSTWCWQPVGQQSSRAKSEQAVGNSGMAGRGHAGPADLALCLAARTSMFYVIVVARHPSTPVGCPIIVVCGTRPAT